MMFPGLFIRNVTTYGHKFTINQFVTHTNYMVKQTLLKNSTGPGKQNKKMWLGKPGTTGGPGYRQ